MNNLQDMFKVAEDKIAKALDSCGYNGDFRTIVKNIMDINERVFDMLWDEDTINSDEYDLEDVDLVEVHKKLERLQ